MADYLRGAPLRRASAPHVPGGTHMRKFKTESKKLLDLMIN